MPKVYSDEDVKVDAPAQKTYDDSEVTVSSGSSSRQDRINSVADALGEAISRSVKAGPTSFLNLTGGPITQIAHDIKSVGLERGLGWNPNAAEAMAGATDPQALLGVIEAAASTGAGRLATASPGALERLVAQQRSAQGRQLVSRLLPDLDLQPGIKAGGSTPAQVEAMNLITKTKNPQDIVNRLHVERGKVLATRDALIEANNQPVNLNFLANRVRLILKKQIDNSSPADRVKLGKEINNEITWMREQPKLDTMTVNKRKSFLYDETQGLQKKQLQGKQIVTTPEKELVKDAFAQAYKEAVERVHPDIQKLNSRWAALNEGVGAASKMAERMIERTPEGALKRAAGYTLGRLTPGQGLAAGVRELPYLVKGASESVSNMTGKIEKLAYEAQAASARSLLKRMSAFIEPEGKSAPGLLGYDVPSPSAPSSPTPPQPSGGGLLGHQGFIYGKEAENPLLNTGKIELPGVNPEITKPNVSGVRSSKKLESGFNETVLKKGLRDKLKRFDKRMKRGLK